MNLKTLFGIAGCSVVGPLLIFAIVITTLLAMVIPQLPFGQSQAWQWMLGTPQAVKPPPLPPPEASPRAVCMGGVCVWCNTRAYLQTPEESHLNAGRVQGYVRDAYGRPLAGVAVRVEWDGCDSECITVRTDAHGFYVAILGSGEYRVYIEGGRSQVVAIRTNLMPYWGHWTWDVDFTEGRCMGPSESARYNNNPSAPQGLPVSGRITARFRDPSYFSRLGRIHEGVDIAVDIGTPVQATMSGKVVQAGNYGEWGNMVMVQNGPWEIIVAHLSSVAVKLGQEVSPGVMLGTSGNTGFSTGPHVHYEVRYNGMPLDPQNLAVYFP